VAKKTKETKEKTEPTGIGTKDVAEIVSDAVGRDIDTKALRVYLRDSELFGNQRSKRYVFSDEHAPKIQKLIDYIKERGQKQKSEKPSKQKTADKTSDKVSKKSFGKKKHKLRKKVQDEEE